MTRRAGAALRRRSIRNGLLFCAPALIGLSVLTLYPVGASLYYSLCSYSVLEPPRFIGLANYQRLLHDYLVGTALYNTIYYAVFSVPIGMIVAFSLALLLNAKVRGQAIYRTIFFIPSIVPLVALSVLWLWILGPQYGILNALLRALGIPTPGWMADPLWAKPALILMSTWGVGGWIVIYLAGLQDVPAELYEAADLDGASPLQRLRHITLPMMSPHLFFTLVMGLIFSFQYFTQAMVMTGGTGNPDSSTLFYSMYIFQNAFQQFKMGYACSLAWVLFAIILVATLLIFKTSARYVYYHSEQR
jgi:multiple sugar transport system permease protein